jgi:hypothetical protein
LSVDAIAALRHTSPASPQPNPTPSTAPQDAAAEPEVVGSGIGELPPAPLLSGDAWTILAEKDPLKLSDIDLDKQIAFCRNHRRMIAEGLIKKGQKRPPAAKKAPAKKKKSAEVIDEDAE